MDENKLELVRGMMDSVLSFSALATAFLFFAATSYQLLLTTLLFF